VTISRRTVLTAISAAAAAQAQRSRVPSWQPKLASWGHSQIPTSSSLKAKGHEHGVRLDPRRLDDAAIAVIKDKIQKSGIYVSSLDVGGNHIDPDPAKREQQNHTQCNASNSAANWAFRILAGSRHHQGPASATAGGRDVRVYNERYFAVCEKHKVRILWEPYAGGPNIATGPVGWEALFKASTTVLMWMQFDPSHLVWQFMDPVQARVTSRTRSTTSISRPEILWHVCDAWASSR